MPGDRARGRKQHEAERPKHRRPRHVPHRERQQKAEGGDGHRAEHGTERDPLLEQHSNTGEVREAVPGHHASREECCGC